MMTFDEARELSLKVKWKTKYCFSGSKCWCRTIVPVKPIVFGDIKEEFYIIGSGAVEKETAEHIVRVHNQSIQE